MTIKIEGLIRWPLFAMALAFLGSCEGPVGPPGPPGMDGLDGVTILGEVFEVDATFNQQGGFSVLGQYGFEIFESDKVMIYRLEGVVEGRDVWRPLPRIEYHPNGIFSYSYDFTTVDFSIYLEGNFNLATLGSEWLQNQVFRVLILPADFINARMDFNDMDAMLRLMGVQESDIPRIVL
ncbi:MAG: hypothetical protein JJU34_20635 [Lunatimonas sp.]|uniref:hypothetical protein n=1 Tax=Lunatimonas sp. TaxID=2060141 RepID=UPI00263B1E0F|nr:hypothetical protein [Lunatimonas sp.]MCC5939700.1 hypothetical protein [Lunatimonas sp.]